MAFKSIGKGTIIPQRSIPAPGESRPHAAALSAQVGINRTGIVGLVGKADGERACTLVFKRGDIGFFTRAPFGLGLLVSICTVTDHGGHIAAEPRADCFELEEPALLLDSVVQQCCNCLIFIGAVLQRNRGDSQKVCNVGDCGALALLGAVQPTRIGQRVVEPIGQEGE